MRLGVPHSWTVVSWWGRVNVVMHSDDRNGLCNCTRSAHSLCWFVRVCPKAPIEGTQAVESFVGANGNGVVCLFGDNGVIVEWIMVCCDVEIMVLLW